MIDQGRRDFLAGTAALVGTAVAGELRAAPTKGSARVALVQHSGATRSVKRINTDVVAEMVEQALRLFSGAASGKQALAGLFKPHEKVGIKVNAFAHPHSMVNPVTAMTLARLLVAGGVKPQNVRIFDQYVSRMQRAGYRLRKPKDDIWVTGPDGRDPELQTYQDVKRKVSFHWAKALTWADALINVCVPKDHDLTGVTGALKNVAFGVVRPTKRREKWSYTVVPAFHRNNCDPAIVELYSRPVIRNKVRLVVCDAVRVLYQGGPKDNPRHRARNNELLVSTDPVAMDTLILEIVERHRKANRLKPLAADRRRPARFLATAAERGLGINDRGRIEVVKKVLG
jgi:hypothetical protein